MTQHLFCWLLVTYPIIRMLICSFIIRPSVRAHNFKLKGTSLIVLILEIYL